MDGDTDIEHSHVKATVHAGPDAFSRTGQGGSQIVDDLFKSIRVEPNRETSTEYHFAGLTEVQ